MSSVLLRSIARSARTPSTASAARRSLSTTAVRAQQEKVRTPHDYHTVEAFQGMHASEILPEPGTKADSKMRHFTGACFCQ
ncbi:NADH-ubiquinone oxidoreductase [Coprinopsis cinerea AmutBmut pab1-1]|nr:NADH-ubiquinone oxidoreductase [Coprinopsis cinerea AmutBmut pab1-1]